MIKVANTYFLHIPNEKHRKKLVEIALNFLKLEKTNFKEAGLIKNRQRVNLHENKLYTEEIAYKVKFQSDKVRRTLRTFNHLHNQGVPQG